MNRQQAEALGEAAGQAVIDKLDELGVYFSRATEDDFIVALKAAKEAASNFYLSVEDDLDASR